jgi:hypothetical protein
VPTRRPSMATAAVAAAAACRPPLKLLTPARGRARRCRYFGRRRR